MTLHRRLVAGWLIWGGLLALATGVLLTVRGTIEQSHVVLTLLLIVLGGSVAGGRPLGFTLAGAGFAIIDYFFQPPYDLLSVNKPLDVVVLFAFVAAAGVATDLLARARKEADVARQRAREVESLSRLGAATLRYALPDEALGAITALVVEVIGASRCTIVAWDERRGLTDLATQLPPAESVDRLAPAERRAVEYAASHRVPVTITALDVVAPQAESLFARDDALDIVTSLLALPLVAEGRAIGALIVRGDPPLRLDAPRRRFAAALAYYAALAVERGRLLREAADTQTLREASRAKDQVLASVSHDLRTPLTTIKLLAQGAELRGDPAAAEIVEQADRLARMVGDLLELSRLRAEGLSAKPEFNTAEDVVGATIAQARGILHGRQIMPDVDVESPMLAGMFDFVHTLRILGNLVDNAVRFSPQGGTIDLRVTREDDALVFTVADRGPGVGAEEAERIFDAFYRPAGATPDTGHAGLGLSIARALAELQGGSLCYAPRPGGGSEFTLRLPAADLEERLVG